MINCKSLNKSYQKGKVQALKDISFSVNEGELFGIIGPDGAGKTSLFRILTTLLLPNSGTATVAGFDVVKDYLSIRSIVGYMPGRFSLYQDLTVEENLKVFASLFHTSIEQNYDLVKDIYCHIEPFKTRKAGKLSGGMKQKLALCCALIHKPKVLFLDEPTTGVDPVSRKDFWEMLKNLKEQNITIVVSTPYMDEASLCDRVAFILDGNFLKINTPQNIINDYSNTLRAVKSNDMPRLLEDLRKNKNITTSFAFGDTHHVTIENQSFTIEELTEYLSDNKHENVEIEDVKPTIEDCFMELIDKNRHL